MAPHICTACTAGTRVGYLGTSRKRVSFAEYAEELQFSGSDGSGSPDSITEEALLEAQGVPSARRGLGGRRVRGAEGGGGKKHRPAHCL